jgi:hypothetical protein
MKARPDHPLRAGLAAARANLAPGVALIGFAAGLVLAYGRVPAVGRALDAVAQFRAEWGLVFVVGSTALCGGVLPVLVQQATRSARSSENWRALPFLTVFWGLKGIEVDLLYRFEAWAIGDDARVGTILAKVAFDQFVYCPLWAIPSMVAVYAWREHGYRVGETARSLGWRGLAERTLPMLVANWGVWVPTVAVIYLLKLPLQLPVQNIVLCLWSVLVLFMTRQAGREGA